MFGPTCANMPLLSISLVVIIVSVQNGSMSSMSCQTHALHCMLISHDLLYMVMSKGLHVTDVDVFFTRVTGLCVACIGWCQWGGKHGGRGGKCHNTFVRGPSCGSTTHVPYTIHCIQIQTVLHWEGFKDSSISANSGHERVEMIGGEGGGGGGGGAQISCPHQGALVYIAAY